jgi:hypothetical protein
LQVYWKKEKLAVLLIRFGTLAMQMSVFIPKIGIPNCLKFAKEHFFNETEASLKGSLFHPAGFALFYKKFG